MRSAKKIFSIDDAITEIESTGSSYQQFDGFHGEKIATALREKGYTYSKGHSQCSVANFEENLQKDGKRVGIIQSNFLGSFTDVRVSSTILS